MSVRTVRWGLQSRAVLYFVSLLLFTVAGVGSSLIWQNYIDSVKLHREHLVLHARLIGDAAEPALLLNDEAELDRIARRLGSDVAIKLVEISDKTGRIRAECSKAGTEQPAIPADVGLSIQEIHNLKTVSVREIGGFLDVVASIWSHPVETELDIETADDTVTKSEIVGFVRVVHSLQHVKAEVAARVYHGVGVGVAALTIGSIIIFFLVRQLVTPLKGLVRTSKAIADGDLGRRASERAVAEIGVLARSFNHMANRLQKSRESIEKEVEQRTIELVRANRAKSDFLANVSHEIRTPMTAILGFTETLLDPSVTSDERLEATQIIRRNGDHLLQIINDVLDISKIEAGKLEIEKTNCSPAAIVESVDSLLRPRATAKGLLFRIEYQSLIPETILGDSTRTLQVLINLLNNAIKFTHTGSVGLSVKLVHDHDRHEAESHGQLEFTVTDTGIGMTDEQMLTAFQPFTQADESVTRKYGGTGLGLTISLRIAEKLSGSIHVTSRPDAGSNFTFTIPTGSLSGVELIDPHDKPAQAAEIQIESEPVPSDLDGRVLLAEDGPDNLRLLTFMLERAGLEVSAAENGQIAYELATKAESGDRPFDVILMDMQMPVMDGYAATRQLRADGYQRPIVALTAHAMIQDREECLAAGCDDFFTKPIDRRKLLGKIADILSPAASFGVV